MGVGCWVAMEFDEVIEKSSDVASFHANLDKYFATKKLVDPEVRRRHYWALFYRWRDKVLKR